MPVEQSLAQRLGILDTGEIVHMEVALLPTDQADMPLLCPTVQAHIRLHVAVAHMIHM